MCFWVIPRWRSKEPRPSSESRWLEITIQVRRVCAFAVPGVGVGADEMELSDAVASLKCGCGEQQLEARGG